jgi:hypothetical protein
MSHYFYTERTHIDPVEFAVSFAGIYDEYLGGVAIDDLDYVGITEEFDLSCRLLEATWALARSEARTHR